MKGRKKENNEIKLLNFLIFLSSSSSFERKFGCTKIQDQQDVYQKCDLPISQSITFLNIVL